MKNVAIVVQPNKFETLRKKLIDAGVCGMTVSNVEGFGYQKKQIKFQKKDELTVELAPKIRIEMALKDSEVEPVVQAALGEIRTGRLGDGKIFITDLFDVIRVRTGERKDDAL